MNDRCRLVGGDFITSQAERDRIFLTIPRISRTYRIPPKSDSPPPAYEWDYDPVALINRTFNYEATSEKASSIMSDIKSEKLGNLYDHKIPPLRAYLLTQRNHLDILVNELDTLKTEVYYEYEFTAKEVYDKIKGIDLNDTDHNLIATIRDSIWPTMYRPTSHCQFEEMRKDLLLHDMVKRRLPLLKIIISQQSI